MNEVSMRDHWWWRPGWRIGRRMYTWHITFDGQDSLHRLVASYQAPLDELHGLDKIPAKWLHLTMQGLGFVDEVPAEEAAAVVDNVRQRCRSFTPFELTFGAPKVDPEAIMFALHPAEPARNLRNNVRAAIADVRGIDKLEESNEWSPHVSIAYSNSTGSGTPYKNALDSVTVEPAVLVVESVDMIVLNRDNKMYEWETFASVPLTG
ncbi:hypothetical protein Val02_69380 [Virgisporangium aliadipatigenens]|uniref:2'-5' RNA ligase family protein n=1 Tax=Virgisporangium aliadipatigenens TaxID=741659 RepID=A0A8J4DVE2_9ACTN|nr:2'-5' RNA ligase family protein [Virgisporangium aliadipatigenens]GIJ50052.1 hypothetical protein Val02_69380 [Virgisporangium aliadipatigenens]